MKSTDQRSDSTKRLRQAEGGEAARAIFGDVLEIAGQRDAGARPGRELEAEPRGAGVDLLAVGDLVGADQRDAAAHREARGEAVAGGEIDAVVAGRRSAARSARRARAGCRRSAWSRRAAGSASWRVRPSASRSSAMVRPARAEKSRPRYSIKRAPGDPARVAAEIILVPGAAGQRQRLGEARAGVDADLAGAVLRRVELADAEAAPRARGHKRARRSGGRDARPRSARPVAVPLWRRRVAAAASRALSLTATSARISVEARRPVADVDAAEIGAGRAVIVVDRGRGDLQPLVARCARRRGRRR